MSRRLRVEEEKARQLKDDIQEEEDKIKLMKEKIFGPLTWRLMQSGIRIQDLQAKYYQATIEMIMEYFFVEDVLFRNTRISTDPDSKKSFSERILFKLHDHASIIAIDESNEDAIAGVLILTPVVKADFGRVYSRAMLVEGKPYQAVLDFINYVSRKVDIYEQFQCDVYMRYYLLCIHPDYRRKGKSVYELPYVKWADKTGELIFCDPGAGNYTCAVMAGVVPPPPQPEPEPRKDMATTASGGRLTRADKRKLKAKGKK